MRDLTDPPGVVRPADDLAALAARINAEHQEAEGAMRAGLAHAKNAGELLLEAKRRCPHGRWLPWLRANVRFGERTAQAYMRVARRWGELEAKAQRVADLPYREAIAMLAAAEDDDVPGLADGGGPRLPAPLACYPESGLLAERDVPLLLQLREDYGDDVLCPFAPEFRGPEEVEAASAWAFLHGARPLDRPTLWPVFTDGKCASPPAVTEAVRAFVADAHGRALVLPRWEVTAFWWASQAIHFELCHPGVAPPRRCRAASSLTTWRPGVSPTARRWRG
jgi:hypothetical protein